MRNPNYWGKQGFADEVVLRFFPDATDTMVQALKAGELDYAHDVNPDQFEQLADGPGVHDGRRQGERLDPARVQHLRHRDRQDDQGRRPVDARRCSTRRSATRSATRSTSELLVDRVLGGFGDVGHDHRPARSWPTGTSSPTNAAHLRPRRWPSRSSSRGLPLDATASGSTRRASRSTCASYSPNTNDDYAKAAQFVEEWYGELGIGVTLQALDSDTLARACSCRRRRRRQGGLRHRAVGLGRQPGPERAARASSAATQIGTSSDSQYCNPEYDELYDQQSTQAGAERQATLAQMQNLIYDEAPYDILYYDANLDVYRNDRFAGWQNMPADGTPLFTYGPLDYTLLTDATAEPAPTPAAPAPSAVRGAVDGAAAATAAPSAAPPPTPARAARRLEHRALLAVRRGRVVVVVGGLVMARRRARGTAEDE